MMSIQFAISAIFGSNEMFVLSLNISQMLNEVSLFCVVKVVRWVWDMGYNKKACNGP